MTVRSLLQVVLVLAVICHQSWIFTMAIPITTVRHTVARNMSSTPPLNIPQYRFQYSIHNERTGDFKSQEETHDGKMVHGSYTVAEPNGDLRVVTYTADMDNGFQAMVNVKPGGSPLPYMHKQDHNINIPVLQTKEPSLGVTFGMPIVKAQQHSTGTTISIPTTVIQTDKTQFPSKIHRDAAIMVELKLVNASKLSSNSSDQEKHGKSNRDISGPEDKSITQIGNGPTESVFLREKSPDISNINDAKNTSIKLISIRLESQHPTSIVNTTDDESNEANSYKTDMFVKGLHSFPQINVQNSEIPTTTLRNDDLKNLATNISSILSQQPSLQLLPSDIKHNSHHQRQNSMSTINLKSQVIESLLKPINEVKGQQTIKNMSRNVRNEEIYEPKTVKNSSFSEIIDGNPNYSTINSSEKQSKYKENIEATIKSLFLTSPDTLKAVGIDPQTIEFGPGSTPMMGRLTSDNSHLKIVQTSPQHTTQKLSMLPSQLQESPKKNGQYLFQGSETKHNNASLQGNHGHDNISNFSRTLPRSNAPKYPITVLLHDTFQAQLNPTITLKTSPNIHSKHATIPNGKSLFFTDTMQQSARTKIKSLQHHMFPNIGYRGMSDTSTLHNFYTYPLDSAPSYFRIPFPNPIPPQGYSEHQPVIQYPIIHHRYFPQYPHTAFMPYTPSLALVRTIVVPISDTVQSQEE